MTFRDHFSAHSTDYARHRPRYPEALFAWLAAQSPRRGLAVDVATGNGQAAIGLARHFRAVAAFDASDRQLAAAEPAVNIHYAVARAEAIPLPDQAADLLTVAQALHWLDLDAFYGEARRVLGPDGVLAAWTYNLLRVSPAVDLLVDHLYYQVLGSDWPDERRHVESGYATLSFPFRRIEPPPFAMTAVWDCEHLLGYLRTWSACQAHIRRGNPDPVQALEPALRDAFGTGSLPVRWPLQLQVGHP